nr:putative ribonuclease H-like domain-containing protein [Tanacetum cinerariifolium]
MLKFSKENAMVGYINKQRRTNHKDYQNCLFACFLSQQEPKKVIQALADPSWIEAMQDQLLAQDVNIVELSINIVNTNINTSSLNINTVGSNDLSMPSLEETGIFDNEYDDREVGAEADTNNLELSTVVSHILTTRVHKDHPKEQIIGDLNLSTQTRRMLIFLKKMLWIEAIMLFLPYASFMGFIVYQMNVKSASLYGTIEEKVYVCQPPSFEDPYFPNKVEKALYGLHQAPKACQDKYVADILKKFNFPTMKTASTPMEPNNALIKDAEAKDQTIVANSTTKAEYVAAASCSGQFWTSVKVKTVNDDVRLQALVDGKKVIVNEASIRRDLRLDDAEGTACLPNAAIFEDLARMSAKTTAWNEFSSTIDLPSSARPIIRSSIFPSTFLKIWRKQRKETYVSQDKPPTKEHIPTPSYDPLPSGEDRLQLNELMEICTKLSDKVLSLEQTKTNQVAEIKKLKKGVKKIEGKKKKRTHGLKRLYKVGLSARIVSSDEEGLDAQEDAFKQGRSIADIDQDEGTTLVDDTQGRINDQDLLGVYDLDGDEVFVDITTCENAE